MNAQMIMTEDDYGKALRALARREGHMGRLPSDMKGRHGLSDSQMQALRVIVQAGKPVLTRDVTEVVGCLHGTMQSRVSYLVANGMIECCGRKGVQFLYRPTRKGRATVREAME